MLRPISAPALTATVLGIALSAPMLSAQQAPPESPPPIYPMMSARGASHVLRTGWDYIQYEEYERALKYLREAEKRQSELSDAERQALKQGIERAQRGMREAVGGSNRSYAISGSRRAGAIALAPPARDPNAPAMASAVPSEPIQLTSGTSSAQARGEPPAPAPPAVRMESPAPALPEVPRARPAPVPVPAIPPAAAPALVPTEPDPVALPPLSSEAGVPTEAPAPLPDLAPRAEEQPKLPEPRPEAADPVPSTPIAVPGPETEALPPLPDMAAPAPVEPPPAPSADSFPVPAPAQGTAELPPLPAETSPGPDPATPSPAPATDAEASPPLPDTRTAAPARTAPSLPTPTASAPAARSDPPTPTPTAPPLPVEPSPGSAPETSSRPDPRDLEDPPTTLSPELQREVERIARQQDEEDMLRNRGAGRPAPGDPPASDAPGMPDTSATRLELPRPPSPTEARPLRAIPVPEEFVPLARRDWAPNRKVWAATGMCNKPLYFQDAALERYGQTAEQYVGPLGRFLSYPLDDQTQSNQRNQIAQPFFSIGLFAAQIAMLPYNMLIDPPWEPQYDLGFYRPGDRVPTDVYYFPIHGVGPPFRGTNY